jgi:hypothetical protein
MESTKNSSSWILRELDNLKPDSKLEDVVRLVSEYHKISPNTYFCDIHERYKENDEIGHIIADALLAFHAYISLGKPLEEAIANQTNIRKKEPKVEIKKLSLDYNHGLINGMNGIKTNCVSDLVQKVAKAVKESDYVIPRTYSNSAIFDPRLLIIGYIDRNDREEVSSMQNILDVTIGADNRKMLAIDCKEGSFEKALLPIAGKLYPPIDKYISDDKVEIFGIDDKELLEARERNHLDYRDIAKKRLDKTIIPNLINMHREYPEHNIVALLNTDVSLENHSLYWALEGNNIPYMVAFPRALMFWKNISKDIHMQRLKDLAEARFNKFFRHGSFKEA